MFLDQAPRGARVAHYALAYAAAVHGHPGATVSVPEGVTPEEAERVRRLVADLLGA